MYCFRILLFLFCVVMVSALSGCGGGSGGGSFNPVPAASSATTSSNGFSNISTATGSFAISFAVDRATVDTTVGQVLGTATLASSDGATVAGRPVTFSIIAGPATVAPSLSTVSTDSTGKALTVIVPGDAPSTTNVIVQAATTINGRTIRAYAPFQIVRGGGVIKFLTGATTSDPTGTLVTLEKTVAATFAGYSFQYMQQLPFKVTDANGNPRVGVPVTLSVDDQLTNNATIVFSDPAGSDVVASAPTRGTVTRVTDSNGQAIFNVGVTITAPPAEATSTDSIIYKAVTTEAAGTPQLITYAGFVVSITTAKPEPTTP